MTLSSLSKDGRYKFGNNFSIMDCIFGRQRKVENDNYRGSPRPFYPHFRKMKDIDLEIIFRDCRLYFWTISFFFFFGRQRKVENDNYWGSPLSLISKDWKYRIIFWNRLYIVDCIFGRFFFFWTREKFGTVIMGEVHDHHFCGLYFWTISFFFFWTTELRTVIIGEELWLQYFDELRGESFSFRNFFDERIKLFSSGWNVKRDLSYYSKCFVEVRCWFFFPFFSLSFFVF